MRAEDVEILCGKDKPEMREKMKDMLKDGYIPKSIGFPPRGDELCVLMVKMSK